MDEVWVTVEEFPDYKISSEGRVMKTANGKLMKESYTNAGVAKIGFVMGGRQYTRSIKVLVAEAFVEGCDDIFDTPIHLDNNNRNNRADNLVWRPRWFAWKYHRQFEEFVPGQDKGPIQDTRTGELYLDMVEAATTHGLLVYDIWKSIRFGEKTFPTWHTFRIP